MTGETVVTAQPSKYRFLLINAFSLAPGNDFQMRSFSGPKETQIYNYEDVKPFLAGRRLGSPSRRSYDARQLAGHDQAGVHVGRQQPPRRWCARPAPAARYNAIVLLGGGDPGYLESREIGRQYRIPVTSSAHAQMHLAGLLGNKFSIVDIAGTHNMQMYQLVVQYRMTERCASIRNVNYPLPSPNFPNDRSIEAERDRAVQSGSSGHARGRRAEIDRRHRGGRRRRHHARLFRGLLDAAAAAGS